MGISYGISCRECDYSECFIIGIEMFYCPSKIMDFDSEITPLQGLISSQETIDHIRSLLQEKKAVFADNYGHEVYHCPKCGEFFGRFYIRLDYDGGFYEVEHKCPKCDVKLNLIEHDVAEDNWGEKQRHPEKYPCPKCGKYCLYESGDMMIVWG